MPSLLAPLGGPSILSQSFSALAGRRVLVTGAGGSIGSALVRAIRSASPDKLILLDASEYALYEIDRLLHERSEDGPAAVEHTAILGSVSDLELLASIFASHRPEIVIHAAAFKHVPLLERNPFAAIGNNVLGTYNLLQTAIQHAADEFVLISTDKAVDPTSIMGASKRIAELVLIARANSSTRMSAVRLGNVWASQGSVVELLLKQIAQGGPLTVTDPNASRFFMLAEDAVQAILAALLPRAGGVVLVPSLGQPVRIVDVARHLIETQNSPASMVFTSLRPGDKLVESLISIREAVIGGELGGEPILRAISTPAPPASRTLATIGDLRYALVSRNLKALLSAVRELVPEYAPSSVLAPALAETESAPA